MDGKAVGAKGGRCGNPAYEPTDEDRANVRAWIKVTDANTIAAYMEISRDTLDRHYADELREGRFGLLTRLGGLAIRLALGDPEKGIAPDRTMLIFCLRTLGKWSTRVEVTGANGGPLEYVDVRAILETSSDEELAAAEPLLERIVASGFSQRVPGITEGGGLDFAAVAGGETAPPA